MGSSSVLLHYAFVYRRPLLLEQGRPFCLLMTYLGLLTGLAVPSGCCTSLQPDQTMGPQRNNAWPEGGATVWCCG